MYGVSKPSTPGSHSSVSFTTTRYKPSESDVSGSISPCHSHSSSSSSPSSMPPAFTPSTMAATAPIPKALPGLIPIASYRQQRRRYSEETHTMDHSDLMTTTTTKTTTTPNKKVIQPTVCSDGVRSVNAKTLLPVYSDLTASAAAADKSSSLPVYYNTDHRKHVPIPVSPTLHSLLTKPVYQERAATVNPSQLYRAHAEASEITSSSSSNFSQHSSDTSPSPRLRKDSSITGEDSIIQPPSDDVIMTPMASNLYSKARIFHDDSRQFSDAHGEAHRDDPLKGEPRSPTIKSSAVREHVQIDSKSVLESTVSSKILELFENDGHNSEAVKENESKKTYTTKKSRILDKLPSDDECSTPISNIKKEEALPSKQIRDERLDVYLFSLNNND